MVFEQKNKESIGSNESDKKLKGSSSNDKRAESATAAVESGTLREAFGVLNESEESAENDVEAIGNISEKSGEGKERKSSGVAVSARGDDDSTSQSLRQQIINSKPSKKQMLNDIHRHFKKEQKVLHKKMMMYAGDGDWHQYTGAMARLRQIRDILSNLIHATYDAIKNAWLKVVHGIV